MLQLKNLHLEGETPMSTGTRMLATTGITCFLLSGCSQEPETELGTAQHALSIGTEYGWAAEDPYTLMGSTVNRSCYLTRVSGAFNGYDDGIEIVAESGAWRLGGYAGETSVELYAAAQCIEHSSPTTEEHYYSGGVSVDLGGSADRACFLTGVTGKFENACDSASIYSWEDRWFLTGASCPGQKVGASARCVLLGDRASYSREHSWNQGDQLLHMGTLDTAEYYQGCFLTHIQGDFSGFGEEILATVAWNQWFLGGHSSQTGVGARVRCLKILK